MTLKKTFSTLLLAAILCAPFTISAQVTIGSNRPPSEWSLLDLDNSERVRNNEQPKALHLPRLTDDDRDDLNLEATAGPESPARGLMIFNIDNECVEFWSGTAWISLCEGDEPPAPPVGGNIRASTCGLVASNGIGGGLYTTFTIAYRDTFALAVEFFVNGVSRGRQRGNELVLPNLVPASAVTFRHLFSEDFLRPDMVRVEGGQFNLGAHIQAATAGTFTTNNPGDTGSTGGTGSNVTLSNFYISRTPITQAQFEAIMGFNPSSFQCNRDGNIPGAGAILTANNFTGTAYAVSASARPVERVNWFMAVAFANRLSAMTEGRDIFYQVTINGTLRNDADFWLNITKNEVLSATAATWTVALPADPQDNNGFRLPTESEWEFAARGGVYRNSATSGVDWFFSNGNDAREVWHANNFNHPIPGQTHPVAQFRSNALDLYDMSGNVWEWVWDWWWSNTPSGLNPVGPPGGHSRVNRGGAWNSNVADTRVSIRTETGPILRFSVWGFRLASSSVE